MIPGCTERSIGACTIEQCSGAADATFVDPDAAQAHAGVITVRTPGAADPLLLRPEDGYVSENGSVAPWMDGETITLAAAGDAVPAFQSVLTPPRSRSFTARNAEVQEFVSGRTLVVRGSDPMTIEWTALDAEVGVLIHRLVRTEQRTERVTATCRFDGPNGTGVIPYEVLALVASPALPLADITAYTGVDQVLTAGRFSVRLRVRQETRSQLIFE